MLCKRKKKKTDFCVLKVCSSESFKLVASSPVMENLAACCSSVMCSTGCCFLLIAYLQWFTPNMWHLKYMGVVQKKKSVYSKWWNEKQHTIASVGPLLILQLKTDLPERLGSQQRNQLRGTEPTTRKWSCKRTHRTPTVGTALKLMMCAERQREIKPEPFCNFEI